MFSKGFSVQVFRNYGHFFFELRHKRLLPTKIFFMNAHFAFQFKKPPFATLSETKSKKLQHTIWKREIKTILLKCEFKNRKSLNISSKSILGLGLG